MCELFRSNKCPGKLVICASFAAICSIRIANFFFGLGGAMLPVANLSAYLMVTTRKPVGSGKLFVLVNHTNDTSPGLHLTSLQYVRDEYTRLLRNLDDSDRTFCVNNAPCCKIGRRAKSILYRRAGFANFSNRSNISIFIDQSLLNSFEGARWLSAKAIQSCHEGCSLSTDARTCDIFFTHQWLPNKRSTKRVYAVLNMEPYTTQRLPRDARNVILTSFHVESDLVVTYAYSVMNGLGTCVGNPDGIKKGRACENMVVRNTSFYRWCGQRHGGDFFACIFNAIPHILRTAPANKSEGALASAWVSETCTPAYS